MHQYSGCRPLTQSSEPQMPAALPHPGRPSAQSGEQPHPWIQEGFQLQMAVAVWDPHDSLDGSRGWTPRQLPTAQTVSISGVHFTFIRTSPFCFPSTKRFPMHIHLMLNLWIKLYQAQNQSCTYPSEWTACPSGDRAQKMHSETLISLGPLCVILNKEPKKALWRLSISY